MEDASQEFLSLRHLRIVDDFLRGALFNDLSALQEHYAVCHLACETDFVGCHQDRRTRVLNFADEVKNFTDQHGVQC